MNRIHIIYSDIDGCILPGKGKAIPLQDLDRLKLFLKKHNNIGFGICSGRSISYMEAMIQLLDMINSPIPCICDGGSILYSPKMDTWEVLLPLENREKLLEVVAGMSYRQAPDKIACLSFYPNDPTTIESLYNAFINSSFSHLYNITKSKAAVDITPLMVNKSYGVKRACEKLGVSLANVLFIGDADNDIELLQTVGFSACPNNAADHIKRMVDYVSKSNATMGVLEILTHFECYFS